MKNLRFPLMLTVMALAALACNLIITTPVTVEGSGVLESQERTVSEFTAIEIAGSANVDVTIGSSQSVTIEAEDNILPLIETVVRGDRLIIRTKANTNIRTKAPIQVTVTVAALEGIRITGSGNIHVEGVEGDSLEIDLPGSGTITAAGSAERVKVALAGSGEIRCGELEARTVDVSLNGSGNITVFASNSLEATIRGSGSVRYRGDPAEVSKSIPGSGSVSAVP